MRRIHSLSIACPAAVLLAIAGQSAARDENPCTTGNDCWACIEFELDACDAQFPRPQDEPLNNACANAAADAWIACLSGGNQQDINNAWNELFQRLQECEQRFETPVAIQMCADIAWQAFRTRIEEIIDDADNCDIEAINPETGGFAYTLEDIRTYPQPGRAFESQITISVGQTVGLPGAGVGADHDASQIPCVRSAHLLATYRTKTGTVTEFIDHDLDPSDGTPLHAYLDPAKFVHANKIVLTAVFMNARGVPVFFETGLLALENSPLAGDYNRDMVTNSVDLIDFIDAYGNAVPRADLNEDESIDSGDLGQFAEDYNSGS